MKNIFIFGYYGFKNAGDEAILQVITEQIKENIPDAELTVLSYKAYKTMKKYNVKAVSRNKYKDLIKAIRDCDIVISGGGSILQDATSARSLIYYLAIICLAKILGKKIMFYGNGFGPITKPFNKKLVKYIVNKVDIITVRDCKSKEELKSIGISKNITVTADVTFAMGLPPKELVTSIYKKENLDTTKQLIGISVRKWNGENVYKEIIAKTCENLMGRNYEIVFIPMQYPDDINISREISQLMTKKPKIISNEYTPKEIIGIISGLDLLIGMRLHSLIFAAIAAIPMVGLEYDPKILSFLNLVGQQSGGNVEKLDIAHLWNTIDKVIDEKEKYRYDLIEIREDLKEKANLNIKILKQFIKDGEKQ